MSKESEAKKIEEKQLLSKKRIFLGLVGLSIALAVLVVWAIIELFL